MLKNKNSIFSRITIVVVFSLISIGCWTDYNLKREHLIGVFFISKNFNYTSVGVEIIRHLDTPDSSSYEIVVEECIEVFYSETKILGISSNNCTTRRYFELLPDSRKLTYIDSSSYLNEVSYGKLKMFPLTHSFPTVNFCLPE